MSAQKNNDGVTVPTALAHSGSSLGSLPDRVQHAAIASSSSLGEANVEDTTTLALAPTLTLIAKFGKERITLEDLSAETRIGEVKDMLQEITNILSKRQKLVGLVATKGGAKGIHDDLLLKELKIKGKSSSADKVNDLVSITHQFILMGTPEEKIFVDPSLRDDLPDVVDDFDLTFNAGSHEWLQHAANEGNLKKFTDNTEVFIMNEPRPGKPLLVLDLDHTLLDFSSKTLQQDGATHVVGQGTAAAMKRPYMDDFLTRTYQYYDIVVWSQTSWRWLETKLTELGMLTHPGYKFCFVMDKTSMFTITSTKRDGTSLQHHVKPMRIIWSKFPRWGSHNTAHVVCNDAVSSEHFVSVPCNTASPPLCPLLSHSLRFFTILQDDLSRNFALNLTAGIKVKAYYRKKSSARRDAELLGLSRYLVELAQSGANFDQANFDDWQDVVSGKKKLVQDEVMEEDTKEE
jgi:ubiquitin-like domain-containing CTD phosphatase 1